MIHITGILIYSHRPKPYISFAPSSNLPNTSHPNFVTMGTKHSHHRINPTQLCSIRIHPFTPRRHSAENLVLLLISFSKHRGSSLSDRQEMALLSFHNQPKFGLRDHITFPTTEVMSSYFSFFDDLFFFGSLRDCCELFIDQGDAGQRGQVIGKELKVKGKVAGLRIEEEKCVIVLSSQLGEFEGRCAMMTAYVEALLHLMIHAFMEM
jgi:hypothetical protein